ncbi:DUF1298 domain-containing protein [Mycolicibacterium grossiae]|uniref:DUF1298 domain-containing protein n=1 Tax=Mycolicibacterium grossiae TaxID=1552759 RepID=A0A1E8Q1U8_9MYCO|nr:DUF1298 domain-containing protein [Mycolicibacterium grossiae]OFJ51980.1 DUF1298 domain-containing protein [Mycolicibacterium grossiae]QEM47801.1 DUF1298 domain-containing protein [Mycolicibacterium grossiae]
MPAARPPRGDARPLTAVDAQTLWLSSVVPSDQYLLYAFDGVPADVDGAVAEVCGRARACPDAAVRVADRGRWRYPAWVPADVDRGWATVDRLDDPTWTGCLRAVTELTARRLDAGVAPWHLHVLPGVRGIPGAAGEGTVAVVRIAHALGDGQRSAALAAHLFGRDAAVPPSWPDPARPLLLPVLGARAARAHRRLRRDEASGAVPPPAIPCPPMRSNALDDGPRILRVLTRRRHDLGAGTVTVAVLSAVAEALTGHLRALGDDPAGLGAEVPMATAPPRRAHNHYGNVGVGLHPDLPASARAERIAADLRDRRVRAEHPAHRADARAFAATPAPLLRWGIGHFDPTVRPVSVSGNAVVSSVHRGPADLAFGGAPVLLTSSFPSLSPLMALAHGVHGLGDVVAVSVHSTEAVLGGPDGVAAYVDRLDAAL